MATIQLDVSLSTISCSECGITFAAPDVWVRDRRRDHATFYCPNGHGQAYLGKSDVELAKAEAEALRSRLAVARQDAKYQRERRVSAERSRSAIKGQLTKVKNRVARGVCPCCNRHFEDLHRHMETKHPDYAPASQ